ncbi:hypothetical protein [Mycobacterium sp. IS-1742]|uniref:hypothetical protein n=1 Tax=Mycobacterium sp. IS-1742 TaxID=1772285 RepID=UPI000B18FB04|nr:hypothetical protein [Mycobacterium sp. IS-1742]
MSQLAPARPDTAAQWFLDRGVPAVLGPRARWTHVLARSATGLAGYAALSVVNLLVAVLSGGDDIDVDGDPTVIEWLVLLLLGLIVPAIVAAAWGASRVRAPGARRRIAVTAIAVAVLCDLYPAGPVDLLTDLVIDAAVVVAIVVATGLGVGSVLTWAGRTTLAHLASAGALAARALPVVLLTVLVFFNGPVWSMAGELSTDRFWLIVAFMTTLAISFLTMSMRERVRSLTTAPAGRGGGDALLTGSPFAGEVRSGAAPPLSTGERFNLLLVAVASQVIQILTVALVTMALFFVLGLIVVSPAVLTRLTAGHTDRATFLDVTWPVPLALLHVVLFLGGLTFMYLSARAATDPEHRVSFLDPLIEDLRVTLVARDVFRAVP